MAQCAFGGHSGSQYDMFCTFARFLPPKGRVQTANWPQRPGANDEMRALIPAAPASQTASAGFSVVVVSEGLR